MLGPCRIDSPLRARVESRHTTEYYVGEDDCVLFHETVSLVAASGCPSPSGVGLVKLMGRHSGFIACYASLAAPDANDVLIPEVPFRLEGPGGLLERLLDRVRHKGHGVIVAAEGAGQDLFDDTAGGIDASGNRRLRDVGVLLKERIERRFAAANADLRLSVLEATGQPSFDAPPVTSAAGRPT